MGFLNRIFGKRERTEVPPPEHAVLVHFMYGSTDLSNLIAVEEQLEMVLQQTGTGELDGNEVATDGSDGTLFLYGPDARALFGAIRPTLEAVEFMKGARVVMRFGPPEDGVKEIESILGT
jgi:hypothetical protein